jgi:leucine dehydrogenase
MAIFSSIDFDEHEHVSFFYDKETQLKTIIALHNTVRGPALGGCRIWPYAEEFLAIKDALRLARAMTYKAALADLPYGGGKAIIIGEAYKDKSPALLCAFGKCVEGLNGCFITAEDVGTSVDDMDIVRETTSYVLGTGKGSGDPSPMTAIGIYEGMRVAVYYRWGKTSLSGVKIAIQGLGHVGYSLCKLLSQAGAQLIVADIRPKQVGRILKELKANAVDPEEIYDVEADIFSPCGLGAIINDGTIPRFKCSIIAGSANNQLENPAHGKTLKEKNILYAPDYVINAGGMINVSYESHTYDAEKVKAHIRKTYDTLLDIFQKADELQLPTSDIADQMAREKLTQVM